LSNRLYCRHLLNYILVTFIKKRHSHKKIEIKMYLYLQKLYTIENVAKNVKFFLNL